MQPQHWFPLTAHTITLSVLTYIIDQADRGEFSGLLGPLEASEIDELRNLAVRDLLRLTEQRQPIISLAIDERQLRLGMARLRQRHHSEADQLWFVRRGAPQALMFELFGTSGREFKELRRTAGVLERGRSSSLQGEEASKLFAAWAQLSPKQSLVDRYRQIGEQFPELNLGSIYNTLQAQ